MTQRARRNDLRGRRRSKAPPVGIGPVTDGAGAGPGGVRAAELLSVQRTAGNRAATVVARREGPGTGTAEPKKTSVDETPACQIVMPRLEAEAYLIATSSIGSFVRDRLAAEAEGPDDRCLMAPHLEVLDEQGFKAAFVEYATGTSHPDRDEVFTPESAREFVEEHVGGFQDGPRTVLRLSRAEPGITIHEVLHRLSSDWASEQPRAINEGMTEHLTRVVAEEQDIAYSASSYDEEVAAVRQLEDIVGREAIADAYFEGRTNQLFGGLSGVRYSTGRLNYDNWARAMDDDEYLVARLVLEGEAVEPEHGPMTPADGS